ncbi:MAG: DUF4423 domain-containing protein [Bdellovibrionia bacterium]
MVVEHLREELKRRCERNPRYSIRAFARSLNIHPSTLAAILSQKRPLTPKTAERLLSSLGMDPIERQKMISSLLIDGVTEKPFGTVEEETARARSSWNHAAVMNLLRTNRAPTTIAGISRRLELAPIQVNEILTRLIYLDFIQPAAVGWALMGAPLDSQGESESLTVSSRIQLLDRAKNSLKEDMENTRDFAGVTLTGSAVQLREARDLIRSFCGELSRVFDRGPADEVYHLSVQLFPLSHADSHQA